MARGCGADHVLLSPRPSDLAFEVRRLTRGGEDIHHQGSEAPTPVEATAPVEASRPVKASRPVEASGPGASRGVPVPATTQLYGGLPVDGVHAVYDGVGLATWEASLDP